MEHMGNDTDRIKPKYSQKNLSHATSYATNFIMTGPGSNPGLRGESPATRQELSVKQTATFVPTLHFESEFTYH